MSVAHHDQSGCDGGSILLNPSGPPNTTIGDDTQQPPVTVGYSLNHVAIFVEDFEGTVGWYRDVLGLRTILRSEWDIYKIAHIGYPSNDTSTNNQASFLEILWYKVRPKFTSD